MSKGNRFWDVFCDRTFPAPVFFFEKKNEQLEVSTALKDGSTIPLNGLVAQIASVKCVSNPLEEAAEDQTEESDGNGSD